MFRALRAWKLTCNYMSIHNTLDESKGDRETSWSCLCKRHWRKKKQNMPELSLSLELLNCARASGYCSIPVLFLYKVYTEPKWFKIIFLVIIVRNTHLWRKGLDLPILSTWYSHCLWKSPSLCQDTPIKLGGEKGKKTPSYLPEVWLVLCSPTVDAKRAKPTQGSYSRMFHVFLVKVSSSDLQRQHHLGTCWKCRILEAQPPL